MTVEMIEKKTFWDALLERLQSSQHTAHLGLALVVGSLTGLGAVIFIRLIDLVQRVMFEGGGDLFAWLGRGLVILAPALGGLLLGGALGHAVEYLWPGATAGAGAFAVVGMAAVFAGAARAPFTAILIVLEMTNDYRMIVPLMAGVIISLLVAERLHKESIYTLKLVRQGVRLQRGRDVDVMEAVRVDEVMHRNPVTVPVNMPIDLLGSEFLRTGRHGFPVVNPDGSLFGVVSLEDYRQATVENTTQQEDARESLTAGDIATQTLVTVTPEDSVGAAMRRMAPRDLSRLPVVDHDNPRLLLGVVRRNDIVRAYEVGVVRREEARRRAEAIRGVSDLRSRFVDIMIAHNALVVGKKVAELSLPRAAVLVSIRRGKDLVIPHGDTLLEEGDIVTALVEQNSERALRDVFV